ncbi:MAG: flippase [Ignavibacteriae bacterium]|nr:flippase [Ignavibacteriota bacterium]
MNQEIAQSIARNTTIQMIQQIITWTSSFILMLFLPRYLGPVDYGRLYLAMSIAGMFLILIDFDGRMGIAKRIARAREQAPQTLANAIGLRIILWFFSFLTMLIFALLVDYPTAVKILLIVFGVEMFWRAIRTVFAGTFLGFELLQYSAVGAIIERVFISVVGVSAILLGANSLTIAIILVVGTLLNFLICAKFTTRIVSYLPKINWTAMLSLSKDGVPYLLTTIFGVIYYSIDTIMLSILTPAIVVGWYGAAYKFFDVLVFLPSIYSTSIMPILSRLWGKEDEMLSRTAQKSLKVMMISGIPISILAFTFSDKIISLFFGLEGYGPSVVTLQIFTVGLLLLYVDFVLSSMLLACDKQRAWATVAFAAIFVNFGLNYFLIPYTQTRFGNGGVGAAIATIITECFVMISALSILPRGILDNSLVTVSLKTIASGIVMALALWLFSWYHPHWMVNAIVGSIVYLVALFSLKTFNAAELAFMKNFLSPRNFKNILVLHKGAST